MTQPTGEDEFAVALRAAIQARGLSLDRIRYHLIQRGHELSVATISYWQSGRSRPERATSLAALAVLEELLGVEAGGLSSKLTARRRTASTPVTDPVEAPAMLPPEVDAAVTRLGMSWDSGLRRVAMHDRVVVGADRRIGERTVRELLTAERDDVDHMAHVHAYNASGATLDVDAVHNCRIGASERVGAQDDDPGFLVVKMLLGRPLRKGESMIMEYRLRFAGGRGVDDFASRGFAAPISTAHMEVTFHPDAMPLAAERFTTVDGVSRAEPIVISGPTLHGLVLDFGPGTHGLGWDW